MDPKVQCSAQSHQWRPPWLSLRRGSIALQIGRRSNQPGLESDAQHGKWASRNRVQGSHHVVGKHFAATAPEPNNLLVDMALVLGHESHRDSRGFADMLQTRDQ
jgi:hypothetical protein